MTEHETNHWIKVHDGLLTPEHMQRLKGSRFPYFIELLNRADWDTGIVEGYKDQDFADHFDVDISTVRSWRRDLQKYYITSKQGDQCQRIFIHRWRNPRETNPAQMNIPGQPETWGVGKKTHPWYGKTPTPPARKTHTPTYDSHIHNVENGNGHKKPSILEVEKKYREAAMAYSKTTNMPPIDAGKLHQLVDTYGSDVVVQAIQKTDLKDKKSIDYLIGAAAGIASDQQAKADSQPSGDAWH